MGVLDPVPVTPMQFPDWMGIQANVLNLQKAKLGLAQMQRQEAFYQSIANNPGVVSPFSGNSGSASSDGGMAAAAPTLASLPSAGGGAVQQKLQSANPQDLIAQKMQELGAQQSLASRYGQQGQPQQQPQGVPQVATSPDGQQSLPTPGSDVRGPMAFGNPQQGISAPQGPVDPALQIWQGARGAGDFKTMQEIQKSMLETYHNIASDGNAQQAADYWNRGLAYITGQPAQYIGAKENQHVIMQPNGNATVIDAHTGVVRHVNINESQFKADDPRAMVTNAAVDLANGKQLSLAQRMDLMQHGYGKAGTVTASETGSTFTPAVYTPAEIAAQRLAAGGMPIGGGQRPAAQPMPGAGSGAMPPQRQPMPPQIPGQNIPQGGPVAVGNGATFTPSPIAPGARQAASETAIDYQKVMAPIQTALSSLNDKAFTTTGGWQAEASEKLNKLTGSPLTDMAKSRITVETALSNGLQDLRTTLKARGMTEQAMNIIERAYPSPNDPPGVIRQKAEAFGQVLNSQLQNTQNFARTGQVTGQQKQPAQGGQQQRTGGKKFMWQNGQLTPVGQ